MWHYICNRPLNVTCGDLRTSAERDNSIHQHSQLFVHVSQRTWEDRSYPGANKRQPDIHHALAIVKVASEGHNGVSDGVMHSTFSLVGLNEHLLTFRQFRMICDRNLSPFQMKTACRILILTRRYSRGFGASVAADWCHIALKVSGVWLRPSMYLIHATNCV
jgi:hypothetical protein